METVGKGAKVRGVVNCIAFVGFVCGIMYVASMMIMHILDAVVSSAGKF